jgi:hypothetical protein
MNPRLIVPVRIPASCPARWRTVFCIWGLQAFMGILITEVARSIEHVDRGKLTWYEAHG